MFYRVLGLEIHLNTFIFLIFIRAGWPRLLFLFWTCGFFHVTSPARLTASLLLPTPIFAPHSHWIPWGHLQKKICLSDNGKFILNAYFSLRSTRSVRPLLLTYLFWRVVFAQLKGHADSSAFRQDCLAHFWWLVSSLSHQLRAWWLLWWEGERSVVPGKRGLGLFIEEISVQQHIFRGRHVVPIGPLELKTEAVPFMLPLFLILLRFPRLSDAFFL